MNVQFGAVIPVHNRDVFGNGFALLKRESTYDVADKIRREQREEYGDRVDVVGGDFFKTASEEPLIGLFVLTGKESDLFLRARLGDEAAKQELEAAVKAQIDRDEAGPGTSGIIGEDA